MIKLALIVNPIAGMGGSVGLKGTDGVLEEAILRGALPKSNIRCKTALEELLSIKNNIHIVTCSGEMGEDIVRELGFNYSITYSAKDTLSTSSFDTISACNSFLQADVDLIIFAGGDGTARDVCSCVHDTKLCIGIPTGVKIHSEAFAINPKLAGAFIKLYVEGKANLRREVEVVDLDEDEYRKGKIFSKLYGYLTIPYEQRFMQSKKAATPISDKESQYQIAYEVISEMKEDTYYIVGPGSTNKVLMDVLEIKNTLIGVDLIFNKKLVQNDLTEVDILKILDNGYPSKLILTPTGGQGYLLGRGNQQISANVINKLGKENIIAVATKYKLASFSLGHLLVDVIDEETNKYLEGYIKVITGYKQAVMYKIVS